MYSQLVESFAGLIDIDMVRQMALRIYSHDRSLCYSEFAKSAAYCRQQLEQYADCKAEIQSLPADGRTASLDTIMPKAWEFERASLEVINSDAIPKLSSDVHGPFLVANRCHPTPPEGIAGALITIEEVRQGKDLRGKFVYARNASPAMVYREICASGAAGIISAYSEGPDAATESCWWINGWGKNGWYHAEDEDTGIPCFSCPPNWGLRLEELMRNAEINVLAKVASRVYDGEIALVNAQCGVGGEGREVLLVSHLYEPFLSDNAIGAASCIEIARVFNLLRNKGIIAADAADLRILLGMELYGFAPYFANPNNCGKAICSINTDTTGRDLHKMSSQITQVKSPASLPFYGDLLLRDIWRKQNPDIPLRQLNGTLSDDMFMSDRMLGIPTSWLLTPAKGFHHNGFEDGENLTDWDIARRIITANATYAAVLASVSPGNSAELLEIVRREAAEELEADLNYLRGEHTEGRMAETEVSRRGKYLMEWQIGRIESMRGVCSAAQIEAAISKICDNVGVPMPEEAPALPKCIDKGMELGRVYSRMLPGMPMSLVRVPANKRTPVVHFSYSVLNWIDGKRSLGECIERAEFESGCRLCSENTDRLLEYVILLEEHGYLKREYGD